MLKLIYTLLLVSLVSAQTAFRKPCWSPEDCSAGECCKTGPYLLGKRAARSGFCEPLGSAGSSTCVADKRRCSTADDCYSDECCVSLNRPRGRKRSAELGVCRKMATTGNSCLVEYGSGIPSQQVFMCPCIDGLECTPNGQRDYPLGDLGTCAVLGNPVRPVE